MKNKNYIAVWLFILLTNLITPTSFAAFPSYANGQVLPSLAPMLEKSIPAVVNISTTINIRQQQSPLARDPFFRYFFQFPKRKRQKNSLGSGVIIDSQQGYVLTNHHVIDKADKITVTLSDGRELNATLLGADPESDVAVIQILADRLTALPVADSNDLKVGDFVVAIGNPFGLGQTVTSGIISALGRSGLGIEGYEDFIQTDASINQGNSGGALVNLRGEFIGMNTAILAPNGGNVGIGFAIPANMVMTLKNLLITHGEVKRGLLGITTQNLTSELMQAFNLKRANGVVVSKVEGNSAAMKAGIEPGDIILSINNKPAKNSHSIRNIIGLLQIGDEAHIKLMRGNKKKSVLAIIGKPQFAQINGDTLHRALKGTVLTATHKEQVEGVLFANIDHQSLAWRRGIRVNDIIVSANRYRIRNLEQLKKAIHSNNTLLINIQRGSEAFFLVFN